jgi:hypothetical protein
MTNKREALEALDKISSYISDLEYLIHDEYCNLILSENEFDEINCRKYDVLKTIRAALESMQWQPIETAPKDGSVIYLYCPRFNCTRGSWKHDEYFRDEERWFSEDGDSESTGYYYVPLNPTHWMPIPTPPESEEV